MADTFVPVQNPLSTDTRLDAEGPLTVSGVSVVRERIQLAGTVDVALVGVLNVDPAATAYGLSIRDIPQERDVTYLASVGRTTTQTQADQTNWRYRGITVVLDVTAQSGGSITLEIDYKDPASGKYIALLTGAAVTTVSTTVYRVYPGMGVEPVGATTGTTSSADNLGKVWRIKVTANNGSSITYSVGYTLMP